MIARRFIWRDERGMAVLEWPLAVFLLLVPIAALAALVPTWSERQTIARDAATTAARAAVLEPNPDEAMAAGEAAVELTATNFGVDPDDITVSWTGEMSRGGSITATVTIRMPAVAFPMLRTVDAWSWSASHTERVDDYGSRE